VRKDVIVNRLLRAGVYGEHRARGECRQSGSVQMQLTTGVNSGLLPLM
jgi:hypothetical protein